MIDLEKEREAFEAGKQSDPLAFSNYGDFVVWLKRAELAQAEITELKQKLARYENPDYVLVPRTPNKKMLKEMESGYYFEQGWSHYFGEEAYDRMLKAVEKEDTQQDS